MSSRLRLVAVLCAGVALVIACGSTEDAPLIPAADAGDVDGGSSGGSSGTDSGANDGATTTTDSSSLDLCSATTTTCGTGRKCDPALGCVECTADLDCTAAGRDPFCILGRCEACRTNADCGVAAPVCFPGDHQCHRSCLIDGGTRCQDQTTICDATTGACIGCNSATDCPATNPICEPTTKSCVSCTKNTDCPAARPRCRIPRFACVECLVTADCGAGRVCNPENRCVTACTTNQQCTDPNTPKCDVPTGRCVQCAGPTDCTAIPNRPICATTGDRAGRCVQCTTNADCGDGGTPFCNQDAQCVQCLSKLNCPGPDPKCDNGQCQ